MLLSERESGLRKTRLEIGPLGRMDRREESCKIVRVRSRNDLRHLKLVSQTPVALSSCNRATSFGLSDLQQTSEHQHKQFALHFKQLTAS